MAGTDNPLVWIDGAFGEGGGEIHFDVQGGLPTVPVACRERGKLERLRVFLATSQLPDPVAARGREAALKGLAGYGVEVAIEARDLPSPGAGAATVVVAECEIGIGGWTGLGERGKPMERVVEEAVRGFQRWFASGTGVDEHLADQLALPCALLPRQSRWTTPEITEHLRTVLWVAQQFLPVEVTLEERADGSGLVTVRGVALKRDSI